MRRHDTRFDMTTRRAFLKRGIQASATLLAASQGAAQAQPRREVRRDEDSAAAPSLRGGRRPLDDEDPNVFVFSRFKFKGKQRTQDEWDTLPSGDDNLLRHIAQATNIKLTKRRWEERVVEIDDFEKLYNTPFLFMTGQVDFTFEVDEAEALREYFKRGGFLYADDCDADVGRLLFYEAFTREIQKVLPGHKMERLPHDHELYHCFYDIPDGSSWSPRQRAWEPKYPDSALFVDDRMVCFLTGSDQHCGWAQRRRELYNDALKLGTNIVVYALTH